MDVDELHDRAMLQGVEENLILHADDLTYTWDVRDSWMTINNWRRVTRAYLDPRRLEAFICGDTDFLPSKDGHEAAVGTKAHRRRWGACIVGWSLDDRHTVHLHSRTSIGGFLLPLDLAITWHLARLVEAEGITLHLDLLQIHPFKSMPWYIENHRLQQAPHSVRRAYNRLKQMDVEGLKYLDMSFAQECRFRRRFHTEQYGPEYGRQFEGGARGHILSVSGKAAPRLPSHPVESLDLSHLGVA